MKIRENEELLKPEYINKIYYGDCDRPKTVLGYHEVEEGGLFCYWNPRATSMWLRHRMGGETYEMEQIKEGFFIYLMKPSLQKQEQAKEYQFEVLLKQGERKEIVENPYFFESQIEEQDLVDFARGEHTTIQTVLGANERSILVGEEWVIGIQFAIYAPHAKRVSILGDWNDFHPHIHQMERVGDTGVFELWIPEAKPSMKYEFEIKTEVGEMIRCADPYRRACVKKKRGIGLIQDTKSYVWKEDVNQRAKRQEEQRKSASIFYHFDPQLYQKKGKKKNRFMTYRQMTKEVLCHVKEMGYTHVLIKGLLEHDNEMGQTEESNVVAYFAPSSLYGNPYDFQYFVDCLHRHNINVYLEWDISGFSNRSDGLAYLDGQAVYEYENPLLGVHVDGIRHRFCYGKGQVQSFLLSSLFYWIQDYHIDGFSIHGVASMLYQDYDRMGGEWIRNPYGEKENLEAIAFLQKMNELVRKKAPFVCMIAEDNSGWIGVTKDPKIGGLGFHKEWSQGWINDYLDYIKYAPEYRQYDIWKLQYHAMKYLDRSFLLSTRLKDSALHNTTLIQKVPGEYFYRFAHLRVLYGYMFSFFGDKSLFMGEDMAYWEPLVRIKGFDMERGQEPIHKNFQIYMKDLIVFYKERIWLCERKQEEFYWVHTKKAKEGIFSFLRKNKEEELLFLFHLKREVQRNYRFSVPQKGKYEVVFHSDKLEYGGVGDGGLSVLKEENIKEENSEERYLILDLQPISFVVFSIKGRKDR